MTYNVFGGTLSLNQSVNHAFVQQLSWEHVAGVTLLAYPVFANATAFGLRNIWNQFFITEVRNAFSFILLFFAKIWAVEHQQRIDYIFLKELVSDI